jgi:hypothetical protein
MSRRTVALRRPLPWVAEGTILVARRPARGRFGKVLTAREIEAATGLA